jgi:hypothetical protein
VVAIVDSIPLDGDEFPVDRCPGNLVEDATYPNVDNDLVATFLRLQMAVVDGENVMDTDEISRVD